LSTIFVVAFLFFVTQSNCQKESVGSEKFYGLVVVEQPSKPEPRPPLDLSSSKTLKVERGNEDKGGIIDDLGDNDQDNTGSGRKRSGCHYEIDIEWVGKLPTLLFRGPILSTFKLGSLQKVLLFFSSQYFEILEAKDGSKLHGFPFVLPQTNFVSAKLFPGDNPRIALTTAKAEIIFIRPGGTVDYGSTLIVPPLGIEKNWYEGLQQFDEHASVTLQQQHKQSDLPPNFDFDMQRYPPPPEPSQPSPTPPTRPVTPESQQPVQGRRLLSLQEAKENYYDDGTGSPKNSFTSRVFELFEGSLPTEGLESLELFLPTEASMSGLTALQHGQNPLSSRQYEQYLANFQEQANLVYLDPKVLSSPVIVDLNGDRSFEMIVPVSYSVSKVGKDVSVDPRKYVACSLVVFDLRTSEILWRANLDLTTATAHYQAFIYTEPVIVDLDGDRSLDVIITTGVGHVFAFDRNGKLHPGYPLRTQPIRADPLVFDLDHDAILDLVIVDVEGTVKCWNTRDLSVKWEAKISTDARATPSLADLNGDGVLDLILGTGTGHIWALSGDTGDVLGGFPVSSGLRIHVPISLFDMNGDSIPELFVSGAKSQLYIIDPTTMCLEVVDLAEPIANPVAIDDVTSDGYMDLVVVSGRGTVYSLSTDVPFHPLHTWADHGTLAGPALYRPHHYGVMIEGEREKFFYGPSFTISYTILDKRRIPREQKKHRIEIRLNGEVLLEKVIDGFLEESVTFSETIDCPRSNRGAIEVVITNQFSQSYSDAIDAHFNWNYYRTLKWLIVLPYLLMVAGFMLIKQISSPLPS